tara:strand:- start:180 stop:539 length:360 start_codon:yes stop_codon:yes gene_type:complete
MKELVDKITIEDVISESDKKNEKLSNILIKWAKERHLLGKLSLEDYKEEYKKNNLIFWVNARSLYKNDLSEAYNKVYGNKISLTFNDLYNTVSYTNEKIGRNLFDVKSNSYGVPSIRLI